MSPEDPRHGRPAGYDAHHRDGETACGPCREAVAAYEYRRRIDGILGRRYTEPSVGTARRIQALVALGWTFGQIADRLGRCHGYTRKLANQTDTYVRTETADRVRAIYDDMSMTLPPNTTGLERRRVGYAKTTAARNGYVPPLCWDDIDDPAARPTGIPGTRPTRPDIDPVVVERILAGDWRLPCTPAEKAEVCAQWVASGRALNELERHTGWRTYRYFVKGAAA